MLNEDKTVETASVGLLPLLGSFLKIGSMSFGGYMSLVAMLQDDFVNKKSWIKDERILEAISIASFLPGPLAVNISTYVGFILRGWIGALLSMIGVIIPSFVLIVSLTYLYYENTEVIWVKSFFKGVLPVVVAIIGYVAFGMFKKVVSQGYQYFLILLSVALVFLVGGMLGILAAMILSGLISYLIETRIKEKIPFAHVDSQSKVSGWGVLVPLFTLVLFFCMISVAQVQSVYWELIEVFSKVSVTLFGGGYVFIPMMQEIIVDHKGWLNNQEFADAIAMGQITPGPILISAAFVGFKLKGLLGAVVATVSIFLPSALIMLIAGQVYSHISDNAHVVIFFKGLKAAIIGLIIYSGVLMAVQADNYVYTGIIIPICLVALIKFDVNLLLLILLGGVLGIFVL